MKEFIDYVKANPGKLNYGSSGVGSTHHLSMEALKASLGLQLTHVPFKGTSESVPALLGGHVDVAFSAYPSLSARGRHKNITLLATNGAKRSAMAPDVPPVADFIPGFDFAPAIGIYARTGTPPAVLQKIAERGRRDRQGAGDHQAVRGRRHRACGSWTERIPGIAQERERARRQDGQGRRHEAAVGGRAQTRQRSTWLSASGTLSTRRMNSVSMATVSEPTTEIAAPDDDDRAEHLVIGVEPGRDDQAEHQRHLQDRHDQHDRRDRHGGVEEALRHGDEKPRIGEPGQVFPLERHDVAADRRR